MKKDWKKYASSRYSEEERTKHNRRKKTNFGVDEWQAMPQGASIRDAGADRSSRRAAPRQAAEVRARVDRPKLSTYRTPCGLVDVTQNAATRRAMIALLPSATARTMGWCPANPSERTKTGTYLECPITTGECPCDPR